LERGSKQPISCIFSRSKGARMLVPVSFRLTVPCCASKRQDSNANLMTHSASHWLRTPHIFGSSVLVLGNSLKKRRRVACRASPQTRWLNIPSCLTDAKRLDKASVGTHGCETSASLPVLPLPEVYLPGVEYQLRFEQVMPLKMLDGILLNGSSRFVVSQLKNGFVAEYGTMMALQDVQRVEHRNDGACVVTVSAEKRVQLLSIHNSVCCEKTSCLHGNFRILEVVDSNSTSDKLMIRDEAVVQRLCQCRRSASDSEAILELRQILNSIVTLQQELQGELKMASHVRNFAGFWEVCGIWMAYSQERIQRLVIADAKRLLRESEIAHHNDTKTICRQALSIHQNCFDEIRDQVQRFLEINDKKQRAEELRRIMASELSRLLAIKALKDALN